MKHSSVASSALDFLTPQQRTPMHLMAKVKLNHRFPTVPSQPWIEIQTQGGSSSFHGLQPLLLHYEL